MLLFVWVEKSYTTIKYTIAQANKFSVNMCLSLSFFFCKRFLPIFFFLANNKFSSAESFENIIKLFYLFLH